MPALPPLTDGDPGFRGVNSRLDPALIPPSFCSYAKNKRFRDGGAVTRPGIKPMPWSNKHINAYAHQAYAADSIVSFSGQKADDVGSTTAITFVRTTPVTVSNGDFLSATNWVVGNWSVGSGLANIVNAGSTSNLYQDLSSTILLGDILEIEIVISLITPASGKGVAIFLGTAGSSYPNGNPEWFTTAGTYKRTFMSRGNNPNRLHIQAYEGVSATLTSITVNDSQPASVYISAIGTNNAAHAYGAASQNYQVGPYFEKKSGTDGAVHLPLTDATTVNSTYWTDLGHRIYPFGTVYGAGVFSDPNSVEYLIVATGDGFYAATANNAAVLLPLQAGQTIAEDVNFTQAFSKLFAFRGKDKDVLVMSDIATGFKTITQEETDLDLDENEEVGTVEVPSADRAIYFQNRLWIPNSDLIFTSDYINPTRGSIFSQLRINQGSADALTGIIALTDFQLLAFKSNSIFSISNIYGNLSDIRLENVTTEFGCRAPKTIVEIGSDIWFLSDRRGVVSLQRAEKNSPGLWQGEDIAISDDIDPDIQNISWEHSSIATAKFFNNRYYLAAPTAEFGSSLIPYTHYQSGTATTLISNLKTSGRYFYKPTNSSEKLILSDSSQITAEGEFTSPGTTLQISSTNYGGAGLLTGLTFDNSTTSTVVPLAIGTTYQFTRVGPGSLMSGLTILQESGEFTATHDSATITSTAGQTVYHTLYPVNKITGSIKEYNTKNNRIFVYDFVQKAWSGQDILPANVTVKDFVVLTYSGIKRLFFVSDDGVLYLYDDADYCGMEDEVVEFVTAAANYGLTQKLAVEDQIITRGYSGTATNQLGAKIGSGVGDFKSFRNAFLTLKSVYPKFSVKIRLDGPEETVDLVSEKTFSRSSYDRPFNKTPYVTSNSNNDYNVKYRLDYSVDPDENFDPGTGMDLGLKQESVQKYNFFGNGRYCQLDISNNQGTLEVANASVAALPGRTENVTRI